MENYKEKITCSFTCDRELYLAFKSIVVGKGENVKGALVRHMIQVVQEEKDSK